MGAYAPMPSNEGSIRHGRGIIRHGRGRGNYKMERSLFRKYFSVCATMILMSIAILGLVFLVFASQYFREDKMNTLRKNASYAAEITQQYCLPTGDRSGYEITSKFNLVSTWIPMAKAVDADIYLSNMSGNTLLCTHKSRCGHTIYGIPPAVLNQVREKGIYTEVGTLGEIYKSSYYTVGVPLFVGENQIAGVVFASTSAEGLSNFMTEMLKMFLISALVVMVIAFAVIYVVTNNMVKPLREMLSATESFGKGDFTVRVPVNDLDEVGLLAMSFNNMATSLAQQETVRRSFIANVSHELKTPMTTIAGFVDGILDGTIPADRSDHYLHIVSDEVKRLSRLVRSMLNIAKIEAGEMTIKPTQFDINEIVCSSIFTFEQSIDAKHLEIKGLDVGKIMVEADEDLIHQVVYNLLENAVKFSSENGYIEITYTTENKRTFIGIKNSGSGIPKDEISKVFDRFYKTDRSRSIDKSGVGLGLHIVRSIVNLHQGEVIVRSVEGEYCEFSFSIPAAPKQGRHQPPPAQM